MIFAVAKVAVAAADDFAVQSYCKLKIFYLVKRLLPVLVTAATILMQLLAGL